MFYNEFGGALFVRATTRDLDVIDQALTVLNERPLQVNIRAKFVEVPLDVATSLLGNLALTNQASTQFTGIPTPPQRKQLFRDLENTPGVDVLSAPEVTTLSGRQAQLQVVDIQTIVTGVVPVAANGVITNMFQTQALPFGPVLDIIPSVSEDGHTIHMTVIPTIKGFLGYDKPDQLLTDYAATNSINSNLPLPRFRLRQLSTTVSVWDGQTVVLGGFISETVTRNPDGSESRATTPELDKKQLLVFVTPTVIDPAGNRIHPAPTRPINSREEREGNSDQN